jgi:hypothetical protein
MAMTRRTKAARRKEILIAYVRVTAGRLPENLDELLRAIRAKVSPDVTEDELRDAIAWALRIAPCW